jgi:putative membrane protein
MTAATFLPHVNAALNALSTILLATGFVFIRAQDRALHRKFMLAAIIVSAVFLASYLVYHFTAPIFVFKGTGWIVPVYYVILVTHVILATIVTPMIFVTAWRALHGNFDRHKKLARWTFPIWLYVTVTGVVIYVMLYHIYPADA